MYHNMIYKAAMVEAFGWRFAYKRYKKKITSYDTYNIEQEYYYIMNNIVI
jgi:hypothetical protein